MCIWRRNIYLLSRSVAYDCSYEMMSCSWWWSKTYFMIIFIHSSKWSLFEFAWKIDLHKLLSLNGFTSSLEKKNNANYVEHNRTKRLSFNVETFIFISFHFILSFLYFLSSYIVRKKWLISPKSNTRRIERGCYLKYYYFKCRTLYRKHMI